MALLDFRWHKDQPTSAKRDRWQSHPFKKSCK